VRGLLFGGAYVMAGLIYGRYVGVVFAEDMFLVTLRKCRAYERGREVHRTRAREVQGPGKVKVLYV